VCTSEVVGDKVVETTPVWTPDPSNSELVATRVTTDCVIAEPKSVAGRRRGREDVQSTVPQAGEPSTKRSAQQQLQFGQIRATQSTESEASDKNTDNPEPPSKRTTRADAAKAKGRGGSGRAKK